MKRLYLVRHGENTANLTKEFSHRLVDYSLTPKGRLQAEQTGAYFARLAEESGSPDGWIVYCSPLRRAVETAELIAERLGVQVTVLEAFREVDVGALERQPPSAESWGLHNRIIQDWFEGHPQVRFPEGENLLELRRRALAGYRRVLQEDRGPDSRAVIVAHGGIFLFTLPDLCPEVDFPVVLRQASENCSVSALDAWLEANKPRARLLSWGYCGHLSGEAAKLVPGTPEDGMFEVGNSA